MLVVLRIRSNTRITAADLHANRKNAASLRNESVLRDRPRQVASHQNLATALIEHGPMTVLCYESALRIQIEIACPREILLAIVAADVKESRAVDGQVEVVARVFELTAGVVGLDVDDLHAAADIVERTVARLQHYASVFAVHGKPMAAPAG